MVLNAPESHCLFVVRPTSLTFQIFNFSKTAEWNSTRKQELNVLYQVCVFPADWKTKMATLASDWLRHFQILLWNLWNRLTDLNVLYQVCDLWANQKTNMAVSASDWLRHILLFILNFWTEYDEMWKEARTQRPLPS